MENYKYLWMIIIAFIIVIFICIIKSKSNRKMAKNDTKFYNLDDDKTYRNELYRQVSADFKPYLQKLIQSIDELNQKILRFNGEISQVQYNSMRDIIQTAERLSRQIDNYWNDSRFRKDFSYYIGLHYTSHLLANSLKAEQQNIKITFVECKKKQESLGRQIDLAQRRQEQSKGEQRYRLSKEIGEMCKHHKNISIWKSHIGAINSKYNQRVTEQNIETAKYRDYIASNFGARGRQWKSRCHQRALLRK